MAAVKKKKPKPETEIRLTDLQDRYLDNPDDVETYHEFFSLLKVYARSLTLKEIKSKIYLPPDRVEEVAVEATLKLVNQYKKEDWKVWGSFGGALRWKIVEALYQDADEETAQSLNTLIGGDDSTQELGDVLSKIRATPILSSSMVSLDPQDTLLLEYNGFKEIKSILAEARDIIPYYVYFKLLIYILHTFRRPKMRHVNTSFRGFYMQDKKTEDMFDMVLLEIRERLMHYS